MNSSQQQRPHYHNIFLYQFIFNTKMLHTFIFLRNETHKVMHKSHTERQTTNKIILKRERLFPEKKMLNKNEEPTANQQHLLNFIMLTWLVFSHSSYFFFYIHARYMTRMSFLRFWVFSEPKNSVGERFMRCFFLDRSVIFNH